MDAQGSQHEKVSQVARELGSVLRQQARGKWASVRTAERNEGRRHVWRFQSGPDQADRFLHVPHEAMTQGDDPAAVVLEQLKTARWLDRFQSGPETALILSRGGRLRPYTPKQ